MAKLTDKQKLFIDFYMSSLDPQQAYMQAFQVGKETARSNAYKLIEKPEVRAEVDKRLQDLKASDIRILNPEEILGKITEIAIDSKASNKDKLRALELLGKTHALFTDKIQNEGSVRITVDIDDMED